MTATLIIPDKYICDYYNETANSHPEHGDVGCAVKDVVSVEKMRMGDRFGTFFRFNKGDCLCNMRLDLTVPEVCALIADALKSSPAPVMNFFNQGDFK